jgi:crotonobetainyl-CoA:carnitine CoA-transferase CaiB-like acyl-CoA transferase
MLAGPACGRVLAEHGADVLAITSPVIENPLAFVIDTGHGKRSAFLDLEGAEDAARLSELAAGADVFVQGFRTGALARRGFSPEQLADLRPGIVYVSINCYGHEGPFVERPGWEQLAQSVAGIAARQGSEERPKLLPAAACDYTTGYLGALGTIAALACRAREGGSWHVRVSLARTAMWFDDLGTTCDPDVASGVDDREAWMASAETAYGSLTYLRPVVEMSRTPARWDLPTAPLGSHEPAWL